MKPVCVPCQRFYRPAKNGFEFTEGMPVANNRPQPGLAEPDKWKPYKLWSGDLWRCPDCGNEIIVGVGYAAISEHYQHDFIANQALCGGDKLLVKDC